MMSVKILVLQSLYSLPDKAAAFQIKVRLSFQRFLALGLDSRVPDATLFQAEPVAGCVNCCGVDQQVCNSGARVSLLIGSVTSEPVVVCANNPKYPRAYLQSSWASQRIDLPCVEAAEYV